MESTMENHNEKDRAGDPVIRLVDVHLAFDGNQVLRGVNLEVAEGETVVVVGQSGEGKSVLLKIVIGLLQPDSGEVWIGRDRIDQTPIERLNQIRRRIAMVFQGSALFDSMTVEENVAFPYIEERSLSQSEIHKRVEENLRRVHLTDTSVLEKKPAELSGGMKKRVGVARALSMRPDIVFWDEPTTGLDPVNADAINDLILETKKTTGATSIVVTHDMASAFKVGDRIAMLHRGRIVHDATVQETRDSDDPMVQQFIKGEASGPLSEGVSLA